MHGRSRLASGAVLLALVALVADAAAQPGLAPPPRPKPETGPLPDGALVRIGRPRLKLPGAAINVAFAPSGTTFVSAGNQGTGNKGAERLVVLWDAATGQEVRQFRGHTAGVEALAYSADGKRLVTGGLDTTVRLWDVASGKELRRFTGNTARVLAVACSPDRKLVASMGHDAWVRVWDADTEKELRRLPGRKSQGTSNLQFSPDAKVLAAVSADGAIRLWDPDTGDEVTKLTGPAGDTLSLDFSRDGKRLAGIGDDGRLRVWDLKTEKLLVDLKAHVGLGACVRFSPDGSTLATGGNDGVIRFWDAAGKPLRAAAGHPANNVSELSFSADGSMLASAGHEGTVRLWDVATGRELPQSGGTATQAALSPDGKRLATAGGDPTVRFWDPATGKELLPALRIDRPAGALGFTHDGRAVVTAHSADELRVWDIGTGKELQKSGTHTATVVARLAVGRRYLAASGSGPSFRLWDAATGDPARHWPALAATLGRTPPVGAMAFSPNGDRLAVACSGDGRARLWDAATGQELFAADPAAPGATAVAWSPDGRTFAVIGGGSGTLRVWEAVSGRERLGRVALSETGWSVAFSPDGRLLATGMHGGSFHLWDARTGKRLASRAAHQGLVSYLAFSPDGRLLVTASADIRNPAQKATPGALQVGDGTALVWDVAALVKEPPAAPKPGAADVEGLWNALIGAEAMKAGDAVWRLAAAPELSVPLLKERLPKVAPENPDKRVAKLIVDLDDDDFDVREKATRELITLGPSALPAVREALAATKSREVRRRAEEVVARSGTTSGARPELITLSRGVEVLQKIGTADSKRLLESWADGPAGSPLTREARAALGRTGK
jgi:WD40 repeat protein